MKNKVFSNLFGKELINAMNELLKEFIGFKYDVDKICESLKLTNETIRVGIYLLALDYNYDDVACKINMANKILNEKRKDDFIKAYKNGETNKFLALLGKSDKISLLGDLGLDVEFNERKRFKKEQYKYYEIITNSIMEDQTIDKRDGIDQFIRYKKDEEKKA